MSNTNWRSYSGESTLSYFSQAIGLTVQNFVTPAVGMAVLFALFRGLVAQNSEGLGSFLDGCRARVARRVDSSFFGVGGCRRLAGISSEHV